MQYLGHTYTKILLVVYLRFRLNWVSGISSDNPTRESGCQRGRVSGLKASGGPAKVSTQKRPWVMQRDS